jgi:N-formylglutamate amidohydrolase
MSDPEDSPFDRLGPAISTSPVIFAVPHAGHIYPPELIESAAVSRRALESLEDRHADALVAEAVANGATAFIARRARAWIDLNRDEREIDPHMLETAAPRTGLLGSARVRGGLGLIPRRLPGAGEILRRRLTTAEIEERIRGDHRPWHGALAAALAATRARFGIALLVDCHSMPPINSKGVGRPPQIVIGDRHGRSAEARFVDCAIAAAARAGLKPGRNQPYAGAYTLERHGKPAAGIHALQIEVDRSLYLDGELREVGSQYPRISAFVADLAQALSAEALIELPSPDLPLAAE